MKGAVKIYDDITKTIGRTPLVRLKRMGRDLPGEVLLKLEFFNPLGSVKDRVALSIIEEAERSGRLKPGMRVVESSSGNMGIALAMVCASKGYRLTVTMAENMSIERRVLLLLLGAEVILTPGPPLGTKGALAKALEIVENDKNAFMPNQFNNPVNPVTHEETTALEIWEDTDGRVDAIVCGVGSGGTLSGIGKALKARKPSLKMIAVEPSESAVLSGGMPGCHKLQGIGPSFIAKNVDLSVVDQFEKVPSDVAIATSRRIMREEGIPAGLSAGAAIAGVLNLAARPEFKGKMLVAIIPSYAERYLSTVLAEEEQAAARQIPVQAVDPRYLAMVEKINK